jgi:uncharacterized RDD family membrane protein YckC
MDPNNITVSNPIPTTASVVVTSTIPTPPPSQPQSIQTLSGIQYATTWSRILASFIDAIIISIPMFVMGLVFGIVIGLLGSDSTGPMVAIIQTIINLIGYGFAIFYYVYFTGSKGQTLGKKAMKIKVVKEDDNSVPGYGTAFLREIVGKFVSSLVLSLGYFWAIWDPKKQTWHDKIAHTLVIKVEPQN